MATPPSPHAITGSLSLPGNVPRSSGRKTTWPGEPRAASDMTLYGPGIAFGAPSIGSVVLTRSALGPGAWANETHAVRTNAVVNADFMRRSLEPRGRSALLLLVHHDLGSGLTLVGYRSRYATHGLAIVGHDVMDQYPPFAIHLDDDVPCVIVDAAKGVGEPGLARRSSHNRHVNAVELASALRVVRSLLVHAV